MRPRTKWALGLAIALAALVAVGVPLAFVGQSLRERWQVNADIRRAEGGIYRPEEATAVGERLRAAAGTPGLARRERARRLGAAARAFYWAGRNDARTLFRDQYELLERAGAPPGELIRVLDHLNGCLYSPCSVAEVDELRECHAAIRSLAGRLPPGDPAAAVVQAQPAWLAQRIEDFCRGGDGLDPAARRALLDEAVALREDILARGGGDLGLAFNLAETLALRGDAERAAALYRGAADRPGVDSGQAAALEKLYDLLHPRRADPGRAALIRAWLAGRPPDPATESVEQELGLCYLESKRYPDAAGVFAALVARDEAKPAADRGALATNLMFHAQALDGAGHAAEADAVRRRLLAEFADTVAGRTLLPAPEGGKP